MHRVTVEKGTVCVSDDYAVLQRSWIDVQTPVDEDYVAKYNSLCEASQRAGRYLQAGGWGSRLRRENPCKKARIRSLGREAKVSLREGIERTYAWIEEQVKMWQRSSV